MKLIRVGAATVAAALFIPSESRDGPRLSVRIYAASGAPRLVINGKPRRARIFWGAPGPGLLPLPETATTISYEFSPSQSEPTAATMHFRFGHDPGDIYLDDIRVTEIETGREVLRSCDFEHGDVDFPGEWRVWPPAPQNTVGTVRVESGVGNRGSAGLHIHLRAPTSGQWPDFHIYHEANLSLNQGRRYRVSMWVRAEPRRSLNTAFYRPGTTYVYLGGPPGHFESQIRLAAGAGVDLVSFETPLPWPAPGEPEDWRGVNAVCEQVLRANPKALMIPRIGVYVPEWWKRSHTDELMRWEDGTHGGVASPASEPFRREGAVRLAALVRHIEQRFGDHVAGYHPTGQNTGEWFYMDTWEHALNGYSPCDVAAFRSWLRKRYSTSVALQAAWSDPSVTFDTAGVPSPTTRHAAPHGIFRDPVRERAITDFSEFQQASMADCVCALARAVRTASSGRKLVLFFYGYVFEFGAIHSGSAISGHYALRQVLDCPDIDVLCSPISYFDRGPGGSAPCMTAAESVALAGKMWLNEDDTRTYLTTEKDFPGGEHVVSTLAETNSELVRNVAQESLRNFATWWMDLMGSGWFDDPGMWAEMSRLRGLDEAMLARPTPFQPQVAAVIDERGMSRVAEGGDAVTRPCVYESRAAFGRMGAPYGQYLLDDVLRGRVPADLFVFTNAWMLSADEQTALRRAMIGKTAVWCYAPGWFDEYRESPTAMRALTGFNLKQVAGVEGWAVPTDAGRRLGLTRPFGVHAAIRPLFSATDAVPSEVLATYSDGSPAVVFRRSAKGNSIFVGPPGLTSELLRIAARSAGVHLYTGQDCVVYANGQFVALHGAQDGPISLHVNGSGTILDMLTGKAVGSGPRLSIQMKRGQSRVFKVSR